MVEGCRSPREVYHVVGRCLGVCPRGSLFHQSLLFPKLCNTIELVREVAAHGRLPLCQQGKLRTTHPRDTADDASHPTHSASGGLQVVYRVATLGLSPCERPW